MENEKALADAKMHFEREMSSLRTAHQAELGKVQQALEVAAEMAQSESAKRESEQRQALDAAQAASARTEALRSAIAAVEAECEAGKKAGRDAVEAANSEKEEAIRSALAATAAEKEAAHEATQRALTAEERAVDESRARLLQIESLKVTLQAAEEEAGCERETARECAAEGERTRIALMEANAEKSRLLLEMESLRRKADDATQKRKRAAEEAKSVKMYALQLAESALCSAAAAEAKRRTGYVSEACSNDDSDCTDDEYDTAFL